jgi:hypothetical protein
MSSQPTRDSTNTNHMTQHPRPLQYAYLIAISRLILIGSLSYDSFFTKATTYKEVKTQQMVKYHMILSMHQRMGLVILGWKRI